jgi:ABC-2 type transport system permease protein
VNQLSIFMGVFGYEFRMQIRRRALWITYICFTVLLLGSFFELALNIRQFTWPDAVVNWTGNVNAILPICVGVLLADRLPRDSQTKMNELFATFPGALSIRLLGKYLGSTLATLVPMLIFYSAGIACIAFQNHSLLAIPFGLETFVVIALPGIMFVAAFSLAIPTILWIPLYQFLFVGYWFWGNILPPRLGIPTLSATILTPIGGYMTSGFYHIDAFPVINATPMQGIASIVLLLGIAASVLCLLWRYVKWQQAHQ